MRLTTGVNWAILTSQTLTTFQNQSADNVAVLGPETTVVQLTCTDRTLEVTVQGTENKYTTHLPTIPAICLNSFG